LRVQERNKERGVLVKEDCEDWVHSWSDCWSEEQTINFDLKCVLKYIDGDLIIDYQPLYNNKQFHTALIELLREFGFPEQELERAELGMQGTPPVIFEGVER
jgi:hypothetical protein